MRNLPFAPDPRIFQIAFQSAFLLFGLWRFGWNDYALYATYAGVALSLQFGIQRFLHQQFDFRSPLISALGLCLLLHTTSLPTAAFAAAVAIASKYLIRVRGRHIFNPSAFGIVAAICCTPNAWISPGQWGTAAVLVFAVALFGTIVVSKVQRLTTTLAFIGAFGGLMLIRQVFFLGWPMDYFIQTISTGSLLIFSFFMITDPRTTPVDRTSAIVWAAIVGAASFYFASFHFMSTAPVFVLVAAQPLVPLLNAGVKNLFPRISNNVPRFLLPAFKNQMQQS